MTKLEPYAEYKDSGVEWFPRLPVSWSATKLKHISECLPGGTPDTSIDDYWRTDGSGSPWVSIGDMSGRQIISTTAKSLTKEALASKPLPIGKPGTLLFAMYASVGEVTPLGIHASWNQALLGIEARSTADTRFVYYALHSIRDWLPALYRSNTQNNLNADQVGNFDIPLPPVEIQKSISAYLDRETAQIDELIGKQERLIQLLAEKRQAIITHAVTKGVEPNAPTKPSGIPWLGDIPAHWAVTKVKHYFSATLGKMLQSTNQPPEGSVVIPYLRAGNIQPAGIDVNEVKKMSFTPAEASALDLRAGDLVVVEGGAGFGRSDVLKSDLIGWGFQNHVIRVRSRSSLSTEFLDLVLKMSLSSGLIANLSNHATIPSLSSDKLLNLEFSAPPSDEAARICRHVDSRLKALKNLTDSAESVIFLLKERRFALISAAITGKIAMNGEQNVCDSRL